MSLTLAPLALGALSTLGVAFVCLQPTPHDTIFASFETSISPDEMISRVEKMNLSIVSQDDARRHIVVDNPRGDAPNRLKRAGATFVIKSKFARFCSDFDTVKTPSP
jgi:hypothetical protein